jgi:general secretion pathway protein M
MSQTATLRRLLTTPLPAAALYLGAMILLLFVIGSSLTEVLSQRSDVAASAAMLEQLEGRGSTAARGQVAGVAGRSGSPFLEGATVTVAGAALLQHVTAAVARFGGNVLSSQVDLQGTRSKSGFLTVIVSCDIDQPSLQQLLYDVESGMPFLFVDQLAVQIPASLAESRDGKLRILLAVSGQWQGAKRAQDDKDTR